MRARMTCLFRKVAAPRAALLVLVGAIAAAHTQAASELTNALRERGDAVRGEGLYATCIACHRADGGGIGDGTVPAIGGQPARVIVKQLADFRREQRIDVRMEHFADEQHLGGPQDLADVAAYVASLVRIVQPGFGDGTRVRQGAMAYFRSCEGCHGPRGKADSERLMLALAGQHYGYLERQLRDAAAGRRRSLDAEHRQLLRSISDADIDGIADYLARSGLR